MSETSTTPGDNPTNDDANADSTTVTDPQPGTDIQPADDKKGDDLDETSKSDDKTADDDNKSPDDNKTDDTPASQFDDDLDDWITKRGLKVPETDAEKQALQDLRNDQREFTRERQAKKDAEELAKTQADAKSDITTDEDDDDLDEEEKRLKKIEDDLASERTTRIQSEFFVSNKVTPEETKALLDIMKEKFAAPTTPEGKRRAFELWSSTDALPDLLDLAKARLARNTDTSAVADEAARKERERIARESNANSPSRSASSTTTPELSEDEARRKRFEERYKK